MTFIRQLFYFTLFLISVSCMTNNQKIRVIDKSIDTTYSYWSIDTSKYTFDTVINDINISLKTYCLNDSSIISEPYIATEDNITTVEYYVAHNFASTLTFTSTKENFQIEITKESFIDSLPDEFLKISHLWYNEFEKILDNEIIFRAKVSKPDTDYQFDFLYTINQDKKVKIIETEYGW